MLAECNRIACCDVIRAISSKYEEHIHVYICMCASYIHIYIYIFIHRTIVCASQIECGIGHEKS
jgi:hypothetical protein